MELAIGEVHGPEDFPPIAGRFVGTARLFWVQVEGDQSGRLEFSVDDLNYYEIKRLSSSADSVIKREIAVYVKQMGGQLPLHTEIPIGDVVLSQLKTNVS
jgi:hypothetical protein